MKDKIPKTYQRFSETHPDLLACYDALNQQAKKEGPLEPEELALVKLAISVGMSLDGPMASHTRKAVRAGVDPEKLEHVALLALPTLGLPRMMQAWKTINTTIAQMEQKE